MNLEDICPILAVAAVVGHLYNEFGEVEVVLAVVVVLAAVHSYLPIITN